jgi:hypothetical protein
VTVDEPPQATRGQRGRQPLVQTDLTAHQQEVVRLRFAHLQEVETGFRSGDPLRPGPGEPWPQYDPQHTTLAQRRAAKVAELKTLGADESALLGFKHISVRTLERYGAACRRLGLLGCVDGHWLRASGGHTTVSDPVREAIFAVRAESLHRSRISMASKYRLVCQYVWERFGAEVTVPSYWTLRRVWVEWFGPGGTRQRYVGSAAKPTSGWHVVVHRPGQVVALDTTVLPVKVREHAFGEPVSTHLSLALDVFTHSIVGFRLTLVSDTSVDVAMLVRDVMTPTAMRPGWGEDMAWRYPGIPASTVAEVAGYPVAGLPYFTPETITVDHGPVYKNHHLVEVQRVTGINILPARILRPTDKAAVERTFAGIQSLLFELLPGWQGIDVADRGSDPEADAALTMTELEHLVATWVVKVWQNRLLGGYAPAWDPAGTHSPNSLFATAIGQGGFALQAPPPDLYYCLLPNSHVKIHGRRGVKVRGLWYDGPALDPYRDEVSARGGKHKGTWVVHYDRRDARRVFFQDPHSHAWHPLAWVGLPADGEIPAFGDARRDELLRAVRQTGLTPKSDTELLPVLLDLLGGNVPVDQWPTQLSKQDRLQHSREVHQATAASADRPVDQSRDEPASAAKSGAAVIPLQWAGRARDGEQAVDAERRRRRHRAVGETPAPPPRLGAGLHRFSRLILPADDEPAGDGEPR